MGSRIVAEYRRRQQHRIAPKSQLAEAREGLRKRGVESPKQGGLTMELPSPHVIAAPESTAELDRLGDEIAALATHLDAATARLLDLIREFDERQGWSNGSQSCAHWLRWRVGLGLGAAREHVRVAHALGTLPR